MKATTKRSRSSTPARPTVSRRTRPAEVIELVPALVRIQSILVPIDFSPPSKKALQYAIRMAEQFGGKVTVLNVIEPVATADLAYHPLMLETETAKVSARTKLEAVCRQAGLGPRLLEKVLVRYGTPFVEITNAAKTLKVDLIILTTHGYTGLKHVFMGSTAERVVRHAPCPVLTVREKEHEFV